MNSTQSNLNLIVMRIRTRRITLNYTQTYVAGKLKISQNAYSKIEAGRTSITIQRLYEIAEILQSDVKEFI